MTPRTLKRIAILGLLLFAAGLLWGGYFVGVPYQDPTPAQGASQAMHLGISGWLMGVGVCMLLSSGVMTVARPMRKRYGVALLLLFPLTKKR
jgi:hypothetical protein